MGNVPFSPGAPGGPKLSRREFVQRVGSTALAASIPVIGPGTATAATADDAGPSPAAPAETAVARFFKSLTDEQRSRICFPFDHPLRCRVQNNWAIVKPTIGDLTAEQRNACREIFKNLCSEEGYERFTRQMNDDYGGFERYHVAVFGEPGTGQPFEWVLTGRHNTLRADGNSVEGAALGGPIFYGHAAEGRFHEDAQHTDNVWWYQARQANAIFATLDETQRARALVSEAEDDDPRSIRLRGDQPGEPGLAVADLDGPRKGMVRQLLKDLTRPFRAFDAEEIQECLREAGGIDALRLTFYKEGDLGDDRVWDIWKLEGPAFAWYYHGTPHVHAWLNVARRAPRA